MILSPTILQSEPAPFQINCKFLSKWGVVSKFYIFYLLIFECSTPTPPIYTHPQIPTLSPSYSPLFPHYLTPFPHSLSFLPIFFTPFHHTSYSYLYFPHYYFYIYSFPLNCLYSIWKIKSCLRCVIIKFNSFGKICVAD